MTKKIAIDAKADAGKVNASLLAKYDSSIELVEGFKRETIAQTVAVEIEYMRSSVASGLSVRDQKATLKAGQEKAKADGFKVLPDLGVGKVEIWSDVLAQYDASGIAEGTDFSDLLNEVWNIKHPRKAPNTDKADKDETSEGETSEGKKSRSTRANVIPTWAEIDLAVQARIESMPENVEDISEVDMTAIVHLAQAMAKFQRGLVKLAKTA